MHTTLQHLFDTLHNLAMHTCNVPIICVNIFVTENSARKRHPGVSCIRVVSPESMGGASSVKLSKANGQLVNGETNPAPLLNPYAKTFFLMLQNTPITAKLSKLKTKRKRVWDSPGWWEFRDIVISIPSHVISFFSLYFTPQSMRLHRKLPQLSC